MRTFSLILCLLMSASLSVAQTRRINHRSHSGSPETFAFMMEEDHLGEGPGMYQPIYFVEPFVERIRKHYEAIAKQNPDPKAEAPAPNSAPSNAPPADSAQYKAPQSAPVPLQPKSSNTRKSAKSAAADIPSPTFLVQEQIKAVKVDASPSETPRKNGLWMLLGLLAFPVAPGVFLASAIAGKRRKAV